MLTERKFGLNTDTAVVPNLCSTIQYHALIIWEVPIMKGKE